MAKPKIEKETMEESVEKETVKEVKKLTKSELKLILKTADIDVVSNDKAQLIYKCPVTFQELFLEEYGDVESVSIDLLQSMKSKARDFFRKYWIIIEDVYVPNSEVDVTVEDVYNYLGLSDVYKNIKEFGVNYLDSILELDTDSFNKKINEMDKKLLTQLISRAIALYQDDKFNDSSKMLILEDLMDNEYLFKESKMKTKK